MKSKTALLSLSLLCITLVSHAQEKEKNSDASFKKSSIGFQYNPVSNGNNRFIANLYSIRYGYKIARPLTIGAELTGLFPNGNMPNFTYDPDLLNKRWFNLSTNLFVRYSLRSEKRLQFFLEASPYAEFLFDKRLNYQWGDFFVYVAPGVSVFSKNKKFSMDLYYKLSTENNYNGTQGSLAYKLNFHF